MLQTSLRGAVAGVVAAAVMTLEQPLDQCIFDSKYDDVEILGKLVTRGDDLQPIGFALHVQNGAILGAAYARIKPSLPGPAVLRGLLAGLIEHVATWPMVGCYPQASRPCQSWPWQPSGQHCVAVVELDDLHGAVGRGVEAQPAEDALVEVALD